MDAIFDLFDACIYNKSFRFLPFSCEKPREKSSQISMYKYYNTQDFMLILPPLKKLQKMHADKVVYINRLNNQVVKGSRLQERRGSER